MHRSVSQYTTYVKCGEAYRLERIAKAPQRPAAWLVQGTAVHAAIEAYELSYRELSAANAVDIFNATYDAGIEELAAREPNLDRWLTGNGRVKGATDIVRRAEVGAQQVTDYIATIPFVGLNIWEPAPDYLAIELPFEIDLDGVIVKGFIDQVLEDARSGGLLVRDLKTGTKLPDTPFQLGVYAIAVEQIFGVRPGYGDFWMFKNGGPTAPYDLSDFTRPRVARWFREMDRSESAGIYLPSPGDGCRVCSVSEWCDAVGSRRNDYQPNGGTAIA